jgi:hypothetical protein
MYREPSLLKKVWRVFMKWGIKGVWSYICISYKETNFYIHISSLRMLSKYGVKEWWLSRRLSFDERRLYLQIYGWKPSKVIEMQEAGRKLQEEGRLTEGKRPIPSTVNWNEGDHSCSVYGIMDSTTYVTVSEEPENV